MTIFSGFTKKIKSFFDGVITFEKLFKDNITLLQKNRTLLQEKSTLLNANVSLLNQNYALLQENKSTQQFVDLNLFFSSEEIKKIEEMISNYPETKENWFKLTQAISNHNIGDIFRQLEQIQIEIDQYSNLTK